MSVSPQLRRPLIVIGAVVVALLAIGLVFSGRPGDAIYDGPPVVAHSEVEATEIGEEIAGVEVDASGQNADPGIVTEEQVEAAAAVEEATGNETPGDEPAVAQATGETAVGESHAQSQALGGDGGASEEAAQAVGEAGGATTAEADDPTAGEGDAFTGQVAEGPPPQAEVPDQAGTAPDEAEVAEAPAPDEAKAAEAPAPAEAEAPAAGAEVAQTEAPAAAAAPAEGEATEVALTGDPAAGERVFRQCQACHQVGEGAQNRVGPLLTGVVGRPAAAVEGFRYSAAMQAHADDGLVWTPETLSGYLANPREYVEGTAMAFAGLRSEEDIANVIAYLASAE